jgi:hypothetical protein
LAGIDAPPVRQIVHEGAVYLHLGDLVTLLRKEADRQPLPLTKRTLRHVAKHLTTL